MINEKCLALAKEISWKEGITIDANLIPYRYVAKEAGASDQFSAWLIKSFLLSGWVPPHIMAELAVQNAVSANKAEQTSSLKEEVLALKLENEQLRISMSQMTEWHCKINDFLKLKESTIK